jgi:hypothetical protein
MEGEKLPKSEKVPCSWAGCRYTLLHIGSLCISQQVHEVKKVMLSSVAGELDFIEELRLRRWARLHYVSRGQRDLTWHPVILDEMDRKDLEKSEADEVVATCA